LALRLRDETVEHRHNVRAAYKHEEAAAESGFALIGVFESDLEHWDRLGYEHRMTRRNANCRGMPCKVWRWRPQEVENNGER